ncbi:PREDICTED: homeobox-leucine zipper protein ATHB-53-like [Tarenaya hassleriana]|uniref:homeobox-leucine zipper protein ATHB-53-like n=1 Tax=Tarenaya hassleriana TaxID=28532 RepID=UPI00053C2148|nr:PREDICTED: homeobox-leucine zipper protein ATHB-53-like [Tarenaya hassleriana]
MYHLHNLDELLMFMPHEYPSGSSIQTPPLHGETKPLVIRRRRRMRRRKRGSSPSSSEAEMVGSRKRKLSEEQAKLLELSFVREQKLESERKERIAAELGLEPRQVAVWFQNRRARWKNKKLEEDFFKLQTLHDDVVLQKCHLQSQVVKLKEQLSEAKNKIRQLAERSGGTSTNKSSSSSPSGNFVPENDYDIDMFYMSENNYILQHMEWIPLYM